MAEYTRIHQSKIKYCHLRGMIPMIAFNQTAVYYKRDVRKAGISKYPLARMAIVLPMYFLGGIHLFGMGLIGEYVGKIYREVKQRPRFIIEEHLKREEVSGYAILKTSTLAG